MNRPERYDPIASGELREIVPGQYAECMKEGARWYGWLFYKHPDGQWVSLRKMTNFEIEMNKLCGCPLQAVGGEHV